MVAVATLIGLIVLICGLLLVRRSVDPHALCQRLKVAISLG